MTLLQRLKRYIIRKLSDDKTQQCKCDCVKKITEELRTEGTITQLVRLAANNKQGL